MSTKTIKQRIAVVAVSALTAGFLSVASAPIANAGATDENFTISTLASVTGAASANATIGSATSVGWVARGNTVGSVVSTTGLEVDAQEAALGVVLAGAQISFLVEGNATEDNGVSIVVTGGTLTQIADATVGSTEAVNGSRTIATSVQSGTTGAALIGVATATAAAGGVMTLSAYSGTGIDDTATATNGNLIGTFTLSIAAAGVSDVFDAGKSTINTQTPVAKGTTAAGTNAYDASGRIDNGSVGVIYYSLKDAYSIGLSSGTLTVSATGGANVNVEDAATPGAAYSATSGFDSEAMSSTANSGYIVVTQPVANTAGSTTVTLSLSGTVLATKTLNWSGDAASIALIPASSNSIFTNGATENTTAYLSGVVYVVKDAAGNVLNRSDLPTLTGATGALVGASFGTTENTTSGILQTEAAGYGTVTMVIPTSTLSGAGTYKLRTTNAAGANIDSAAISATVSTGAIDSFTVAWDKASYASGEIATVTISAFDAYKVKISDGKAATGLVSTTPSGFTVAGAACNEAKLFANGIITCKYAAGNEAGSYASDIDLNTSTAQAATITVLKIASDGSVTNAEVLKSIVALIASINKQIQALQKLILKR